MSLPQEKQLKSMGGVVEEKLVGLLLEEIVQVIFTDAVHPTKLHTFKLFAPYKLQYGQVMELQGVRDFFGGEEPLDHST
jgi:hypothetical protein